MRTRLERGAGSLELEVSGRHLFLTEDGASTTQTCFDEDAAREAAAALIAARLAEGWHEDAATIAARGRDEAAARAAAERERRHQALAAAPNLPAALGELLGPAFAGSPRAGELLAQVLARACGVDDISASGFRVDLGDGAALVCVLASGPGGGPAALAAVRDHLETLWLYLDADSPDANLVFGADAGPPEGDTELSDTPFADTEVHWFLQEWPWDHYWFVSGDAARCYALDGGVAPEVRREPIAELLAERLVARLLG